MSEDEPNKSASSAPVADDCVIHDHPVPPQEITRYTFERDPDAEQDIANYVEGQARDETVHHVEKIKTEYVLGDAYEIWDVVTDEGRWWVITNLTNLYSQKYFPSLDYTLSFHIGLMARMRSRSVMPDPDDPHPFDEVSRRRDQAEKLYERAIEPEDYQAVGMQLRETLLVLSGAMQRSVELPEETVRPKAADFIAWSDTLMDHLCPGDQNKTLRQYMKSTSEKTWQLVSWLTHAKSANKMSCTIALHALDTLTGHFAFLLSRDWMDKTEKCPICSSRKIRSHFDREIEPDGDYYETCGACGWSSHPRLRSE
jgi:predicted Zn-ribbon and HTH transcriptional regulator